MRDQLVEFHLPPAERRVPEVGDVVRVRHRHYLVEDVVAPLASDGDGRKVAAHRVSLVCLDDDAQGRLLEVLWELELGARVLKIESRGLRQAAERFESENWPFGLPRPRLNFDPRTVAPGAVASLHAKCVVVDRRWALVGSENFTDRGQHRDLEVGILVDDPDFAGRLSEQWLGLLSSGQLRSP